MVIIKKKLLLLILLIVVHIPATSAQEWHDFKIATGPSTSSSYLLGSLLTQVLSRPFGDRVCEDNKPCGIEGMVAVARAKTSHHDALEDLQSGKADMAIVPANIAWRVSRGRSLLKQANAMSGLRLVLPARAEYIHMFTRGDEHYKTVFELKGANIAAGNEDSATRYEINNIIEQNNIDGSDIYILPVDGVLAMDALDNKEVDVAVLLESIPTVLLMLQGRNQQYNLIKMDDRTIRNLFAQYPYFIQSKIQANTYGKHDGIKTLAIDLVLVVRDTLSQDLVSSIVHSIKNAQIKKWFSPKKIALAKRFAIGKNSYKGIPFHAGAIKGLGAN